MEASQKRSYKGSLCCFNTSCCHGKTRATTSTKNTTLSISHTQNRVWSSYSMARKGVMKWSASQGHNPAEMKQQETTLRKGSCGTIKRNQVLWETKNQSLKRIGTVLVRWVDPVCLDQNGKIIPKTFWHIHLSQKLILRHASWLLAADGSKSFPVVQTAGRSWEKAIMDAFSLTQALLR